MIRVGTAGWAYRDWEGVVYPSRKPRGFHPLRHLARSFPCVEVNATFYAPTRAEIASSWLELVDDLPEFRFTVKLLQSFTHLRDPPPQQFDSDVRDWLGGIEPLVTSGRLAAVLAQFPVSFAPGRESERRLDRIRRVFGHLPLVVELRHRGWFTTEMLRRIEKRDMSLAAIDLPASRLHPPKDAPVVGPIGYLRVHGRNGDRWFSRGAGRDARYDYLYSEDEVEELARRARRIASGVDDTYVITNNHFSGKAVVNALELLADLGATSPRAPSELVDAYPRLRSICRVEGQRNLF